MSDTSSNLGKHPRLSLKWRDISLWTRRKKHTAFWRSSQYEQVRILDGVSGYAKSGTLLAIMGASGAGKTSLLTALSSRNKQQMEGSLYVNNVEIGKEHMEKLSGFVPQKELSSAALTVTEQMAFTARLKMDKRTKTYERNQRIRSLLAELGLRECLHTRVSALSGGQLRRLSLAEQLITDPPFVFCDEVTTGLDSFNAVIVIEKLKHLAEVENKVVICTVHQPASGLFELFHNILLLADGRIAYFGAVADAANYFSSIYLRCPIGFNQAEYFVSQLSIQPEHERECHDRVRFICDKYTMSKENQVLQHELESLRNINSLQSDAQWSNEINQQLGKYLKTQRVSQLTQLRWLNWRSMLEMRRNLKHQFLRFSLYLFIALLIATPYMGITEHIDQKNIQNMQGLMYLIIVETVFTFVYSILHVFPSESSKLLREISNGLYQPTPYYLSKVFLTIPKAIFESFIYTTIIFWLVGLNGGPIGFLMFCLPVVFSSMAATAYGFLLSISFESPATASLVSVPVDFVALMFSGVYLNLSNLPSYLNFLRYFSIFYFGIEAVSVQQWSYINDIECFKNPELPCIKNGNEVLEKYGFIPTDFYFDILRLLAYFVVCHIIGFIFFCKRSKKEAVY